MIRLTPQIKEHMYVERCQTIHPARSVDISHVHDNVDAPQRPVPDNDDYISDEDDVLNRRHV